MKTVFPLRALAGPALLCLIVMVQLAPGIFATGKILGNDTAHDLIQISYVANRLATDGRFPLWDPFLGCGQPYYLTSAWMGHFDWQPIVLAGLCRLTPGIPLVTWYLVMLMVVGWGFATGVYLLFRELGFGRDVSVLAALIPVFQQAMLAGDAVNMMHITPWLCWLLWLILRWLRTGQLAYWFLCLAGLGLMVSGANYTFTETTVVFAILVILLAGFHPARRRLSPPWLAATLLAALAVVLLVVLPRLVVSGDTAGQIIRLGRGPAPEAVYFPPAAALRTQLNDWWVQTVSRATDELVVRDYPNLLWIFIPWAWFARRHRWLVTVWLLLVLGWVFGFEALRAAFHWLLPVADLRFNGYPLMEAMMIFGLAVGAAGCERFLRGFPARPAEAGRAVWPLLLMASLAGIAIAVLQRGPFTTTARALGAAGLIAVVAAGLVWRRRQCPARVARACLVTAMAVPGLLAVQALPLADAGIERTATIRPVTWPAERTVPEAWDLDNGVCNFACLRAMLRQQPTAEDSIWRLRDYDNVLRRLPPPQRAGMLGGPLLYAVRQPPPPGREVRVPPGTERQVLPVAEYSPERLACAVTVPAPVLVIFADLHYPGWSVRVDGQPAPLLRVNDLFKGVAVGAGQHRIEFSFQHPRFALALLVSLLTPLLPLTLAYIAWRRGRARPAIR